MIQKKINYDYFRLFSEVLLPVKINLRNKISVSKKKPDKNNILIVNTCLLGDFMASLPALRSFLIKNIDKKVDIIVSPVVKELAESINGINKVFIAKSSSSRETENEIAINNMPEYYDLIIIMKISPDSYKIMKKIKTKSIISLPFTKYVLFDVMKNIAINKKPMQWREANFNFLQEKDRFLSLNDLFQFSKRDIYRINSLKEMKLKGKKVIIHTGSGWHMKLWPNNRWVEFLSKANASGNYKFIFIGAKEEREAFKEISSKLNFKIYSLIGKLNTKDLIILMSLSDFFVGVDSGPKNMAYAADLRSIVIFGPGPYVFEPLSNKDISIKKSSGRSPYQLFFSKKNGFIKKITSDDVYNEFIKLSKLLTD